MDDIARLMHAAREGGKDSLDRLYAAIYGELHALARARLAQAGPITVLDVPALVNEAYLRLARQQELPDRDRRSTVVALRTALDSPGSPWLAEARCLLKAAGG